MTVQIVFFFKNYPKNMDPQSEKLVTLVPRYFLGFLSIGATIPTRREIECLPYAGCFERQRLGE